MAKSEERIEARKFRKNGESLARIAMKVGVSKSTVGLWCEDIELSDSQRNKLLESDKKAGAVGRARAAVVNKNERLNRIRVNMDLGQKMVGNISSRDLLVAGIALYWAEGDKKGRRIKFTNSDPAMIKMCMRWFTECLKISLEDIYCYVGINFIHEGRIEEIEKYWSEVTGINRQGFRKPSLKKVQSLKVYQNPNEHYGTLSLRVKRSTNISYLVSGLIGGLSGFEPKAW